MAHSGGQSIIRIGACVSGTGMRGCGSIGRMDNDPWFSELSARETDQRGDHPLV